MITAEQRANRKNHLGSSDIPAILGFSKWATPADIWYEKTGRVIQQNEEPTPAQEAGNLMETSVLEWATGKDYIGSISRDPEIVVPDLGFPLVVHLDAREVDSGRPVEVKTEGLFGPVRMPWGEVQTNEVPEYTCLQCHAHMLATDQEYCHVPTFLGGRGFGYFYVERDEKLIALIKEQALHFWNEYVLKDEAPPDSVPSLDLIRKIRRVEGEPVELVDAMVETWEFYKDEAKKTKAKKDEAQAAILAALDGHQEGLYAGGTKMITNYEQSRKEYTCKASTFRVMRSKKVI